MDMSWCQTTGAYLPVASLFKPPLSHSPVTPTSSCYTINININIKTNIATYLVPIYQETYPSAYTSTYHLSDNQISSPPANHAAARNDRGLSGRRGPYGRRSADAPEEPESCKGHPEGAS